MAAKVVLFLLGLLSLPARHSKPWGRDFPSTAPSVSRARHSEPWGRDFPSTASFLILACHSGSRGRDFRVRGPAGHLSPILSRNREPRVSAPSDVTATPGPGPHACPRPCSPALSRIRSCSMRMTAMDAAGPGMAGTEHRAPPRLSPQHREYRALSTWGTKYRAPQRPSTAVTKY